jgi:hypothetical protein
MRPICRPRPPATPLGRWLRPGGRFLTLGTVPRDGLPDGGDAIPQQSSELGVYSKWLLQPSDGLRPAPPDLHELTRSRMPARPRLRHAKLECRRTR